MEKPNKILRQKGRPALYVHFRCNNQLDLPEQDRGRGQEGDQGDRVTGGGGGRVHLQAGGGHAGDGNEQEEPREEVNFYTVGFTPICDVLLSIFDMFHRTLG